MAAGYAAFFKNKGKLLREVSCLETKLYVMTHKEKIGSTVMVSPNFKDDEIEIIELATSRRAKLSEYELREKEYSGYWVYYMSYKGGKDEFGRDYTDIIATIFKYRLTIPEGEKLRKIFYRVKEELKNKSFSVEKAKFVGIKNSNEGIKRFKSKKDYLGLKIVFLFLVVAISAIGVTYGVMSGEIDTAPINDCVDYTIYRFSIASGEKNIDNYKKSVKIVQQEGERAKKYLTLAQRDEKEEFLKLYGANSEVFANNLDNIENIFFEDSFKKYSKDMKKLRGELVKQSEKKSMEDIKTKLKNYNQGPTREKLIEIQNLCEDFQKNYKGLNSFIIANYERKSRDILKKGANIVVEFELNDSNYKFYNTKIVIEAMKTEDKIEKRISSGKIESVGKIKIPVEIGDKIFLGVTMFNSIDRVDTAIVLDFDKPIFENSIEMGSGELKIKTKIDYNGFKIGE